MPLQNSAVGPDSPVSQGAQSPKSIFGDFFCAYSLASLKWWAGRGHLRVRRFLVSGLSALFGLPPCLTAGMVGNKYHTRSPAMLSLSQALFEGMNIVPQFSCFSDFLDLCSSHQEGER